MPVASLPPALDTSLIITELTHRRRETALAELVERAAAAGAVRSPGALLDLLRAREPLVSAALGHGVALIAARSLAVRASHLVLARSRRGAEWDAPDLEPVHLVALLLSPADRLLGSHLAALTRIAALLRQRRSRSRLLEAGTAEALGVAAREALS
jgi:PTS system nitrogen regulatory IIA component